MSNHSCRWAALALVCLWPAFSARGAAAPEWTFGERPVLPGDDPESPAAREKAARAAADRYDRAVERALALPDEVTKPFDLMDNVLPALPERETLETLLKAADELIEAAQYRKASWPPFPLPPEGPGIDGDLMMAKEYEALFQPLSGLRRFSRLMSTFAVILRHDEDELAARLLLALQEFACQRGEADRGMINYLVAIALRSVAVSRLAWIAPDLPPEVRDRVERELRRRLEHPGTPYADALDSERRFGVERTARLLRHAPNRRALTVELYKVAEQVSGKYPGPAEPSDNPERLLRWLSRPSGWYAWLMNDAARGKIIEQCDKMADYMKRAARADREGRASAFFAEHPWREDPDDDSVSGVIIFPIKPPFTSYLLARSQLRLALAGLACLDEPDRARWPELPAMKHPDTGQPFLVEHDQEGKGFTLRFNDAKKGEGDWTPELRFGLPPAMKANP